MTKNIYEPIFKVVVELAVCGGDAEAVCCCCAEATDGGACKVMTVFGEPVTTFDSDCEIEETTFTVLWTC